MPKFSDRKDVDHWLRGKTTHVGVVIAARATLRVVPLLWLSLEPSDSGVREAKRDIILPVLRGSATSWVAAMCPTYEAQARDAAASFAAAYASAAADAAFITAGAGAATAPAFVVKAAAHAAYAAVFAAQYDGYSAADDAAARAAGAAVDAVMAAGAAADANSFAAVSADASMIDNNMDEVDLATQPLWSANAPGWAREGWVRLKSALLALNEDWDVWTDWYSARLEGHLANEALEVARVLIDDEVWKQGPKVVNAEIKRLIEERTTEVSPGQGKTQRILDHLRQALHEPLASPIDTVPSQGPGPRFRATDDGPVDRAPPADLDTEGNDTKTIDRLKPLALRCAADLKTRLPPNQFGELLSAVDLYVAALDPGEGKMIEWGEVWGHGVILQNAATSAERKVDERILPALEDPAKTALESLLTIHGPMILASRDGAKFSEAAANFRLTREQQEVLRDAAQRIAERLKADEEVITPRAAASVTQATGSIGQGPHPERGSVYGLATVKNISIVLVGGAAIATPALIGALLGSAVIGAAAGAPLSLVAVEAVKKSAAFNALVTQLGAKLDTISDDELRVWLEERGRRYAPFRRFVARNAEPLRKIAEATPELKWMLRYIDFISGDKS